MDGCDCGIRLKLVRAEIKRNYIISKRLHSCPDSHSLAVDVFHLQFVVVVVLLLLVGGSNADFPKVHFMI